MPVKGHKPRAEAYQQCQDQHDLAVKEVEDLEFFERLQNNADFKKLIEIFNKEGIEPIESQLEEQRYAMETSPLKPDENSKALETIKIVRARLDGSKDFTTFVDREVGRLKDIRTRVIPELRERLKALGGEDE